MELQQQYFGTDGIRGVFGEDVSENFASSLGLGLASYLRKECGKDAPLVLIGRDTRASGVLLESALAKSLASQGVQVFLLGVLPSPALASNTQAMSADLGIMITASHNPATDNGFKFFDKQGCKLQESQEIAIEKCLLSNPLPFAAVPAAIIDYQDGLAHYLQFIQDSFEPLFLKGKKIVLDLANGAMHKAASIVFKRAGAQIILLGDVPDGTNINQNVGSEHTDLLCQQVIEHKADIGIAYDGDGDRVVFCDETGKMVDGEQILGLLALDLFRQGKLANNALVTTIHSNMGLDASLKKEGIQVFRCQVGDKYVLHTLQETGCSLGGESSGHILFKSKLLTGDGLLASLKFLDMLGKQSLPLSKLKASITLLPRVCANIKVSQKKPLASLRTLQTILSFYEKKLGDTGRILLRYSGTENKLRLLLEGPDEKILEDGLAVIQIAIALELN